jgi:DNA-binding LacI/PurR family transcriptional regulator
MNAGRKPTRILNRVISAPEVKGAFFVKRPTIADIASAAGVSKGAVSYALNGQPGVSEETRRRVLAIAEQIGWKPNSAARALSGVSVGAVGLALARPARVLGVEPFFMELISGIEAELSARSYALTLQVVADYEAEISVYKRWWAEHRVDGVFVCDLRVDDPRLSVLGELALPAVVIAGPGRFGPLPSVWSDDAAAVAEAVEYLAALGHRHIARVSGMPDLLHSAIRSEAFVAVCARLGIQQVLTVPADYTSEEGSRATRRLLSAAEKPTAIIYDNDLMAVSGLSVAQEMGLSVPADLSIVAWDDSLLCQVVHPPLTALSRDIPAYGTHAARLLLDLLTGGAADSLQDQTAHLVIRGSTAPPRRSR